MKPRIALVAVLLIASLSAQTQFTLKKQAWTTISSAKRFPLSNLHDGSLAFDVPVDDGSQSTVNYLYGGRPPASFLGQAALVFTITLTTGGTPQFIDFDPNNICTGPISNPSARPYVQAHGNDFAGEFSRWWANPIAYDLTQGGTQTLRVPIDPASWSSVFGKFGTYDDASLAGWQSAFSDVSSVGLTFGRGCFFGHGLAVKDGTAQVIVSDVHVE